MTEATTTLTRAGASSVSAKGTDASRVESVLKHQAAAWDAAIIRKDRRAIASNMDNSFMQIDSDGATSNKDDFIASIVSPELTISPYTVEDLKIRVYGDTALLTGSTLMHGTYKGKPFNSHYRYTDSYVKKAGTWLIVNVQTTPIR